MSEAQEPEERGPPYLELDSPRPSHPSRHPARSLRENRTYILQCGFQIGTLPFVRGKVLIAPSLVLVQVAYAILSDVDDRQRHSNDARHCKPTPASGRQPEHLWDAVCAQQDRAQLEYRLQAMQRQIRGNAGEDHQVTPGLAAEEEREP